MNKILVVTKEDEGKRLDLFLVSQEPKQTRGYFQRLIEKNLVTVNQKIAKSSSILRQGDQIFVPKVTSSLFPKTEHIPLNLIYEDNSILIVNKPAGMIVHPQRIEDRGTLVQALLHHDEKIKKAIYDPNSAISRMRPGIVHRLDKDTSGVLVVAKNRAALTTLAHQFQKHLVIKDYMVLVYGDLVEKKVIHTNLGRKKADHKSLMAAKPLQAGGREAISTFFPEKFFVYLPTGEKVTLLRCRIETGRTHQIRVHAKYCGYPVLGDSLYRTKLSQELSQKLGIERQMLHASKLIFNHPESGKRIEFEAELPEDMLQVLTKLKRA